MLRVYVALTFDDGPTPMTKDLLELLGKHHVRATLFDIGEQVEGRPDLVKAQSTPVMPSRTTRSRTQT